MANVANITDNLLSDSGVDITTKADKSASNTFSASQTISDTTESTSITTGALKVSGGVGVVKNLHVGGSIFADGNLQIDGNFTVGGTSTTVNAQNLAVSDNMIYMNNGSQTTITNVVANGTTIVYTADNNYVAGMSVTITGVTSTPANAFNLTNATIASATSTTFTVNNTTTGTYTSGGTARAKSNVHPDLGIAAGYNDGTYKHTGIFRDASDGRWKFFDGYTPEPDASVFIDTADPSFALTTVQAATFIGNLTGNVTGTVSGNAGTVTNGVYTTGSYADPAWITSLAWSKITSAPAFITLTSLSSSATGLTYTNTTGVFSFTAGYSIPTTTSQTNWDTAFTDRLKWDGGSTGLVAATGRTSLGATTVGGNLFTLSNPTAITFIRINADNSVSALDAAAFRTAIGASSTTGTVTSVGALTLGTTGTDLSSTVANGTTTAVITLNVPTASATNRGALSSTDWSTFNGKQNALNGTGFVKISGTTISYDNSTYYLASNPSGYTSNTGTVTSVAALTIGTTGTDITSTVANGTTAAVITLNIPTASASNRGALSSADWSTFNGKQGAITLTTTGTSGAATLVGNTLNIPQYTGGSGGGGLTWSEVTTTTQTAAVSNGYIANNAALVTITLPTTASVGSTIRIAGEGAGGWRLAQNASQLIYFGTSTTTTGVTGYLQSFRRRDCIELICVTANTEWQVISSIGNITVV